MNLDLFEFMEIFIVTTFDKAKIVKGPKNVGNRCRPEFGRQALVNTIPFFDKGCHQIVNVSAL